MRIRARLSLFACIILAISIIVVRFAETPKKVLTWDVFGYYLYLPANFIYHDPGLTNTRWMDDIVNKYEPSPTLYQFVDISNGKKLIKYSSGLAVIYSPFFFIAHWLSPILGYPADGFSLPYQYLLSFGGILWAIAGVFLLRKLLLYYFNDLIAAISIILVIAGTNYFHMVSIDGTLLTHNYLFTLYVLLILITIKWHDKPTAWSAIFMGLTCGLISLVRPSEAVCFLIPILWQTGTAKALLHKVSLLRKYPVHILLMLFTAILIGTVQFYYWKSITGKFVYYSYNNNPGEGFRFFPPYITEFLFSFRKGWLIYTPVMMGALVGLYVMFKKYRENLPAIVAFLVIDIWIISSWTAWWYGGGSFSSRSLVPAYALLAIPLAYLVKEMIAGKWRWPALVIFSFLVVLNLFQSWQFNAGIIDKERMTRDYYFAIFGKTHIDKEKLDELLLVDRSTETNETPRHTERYSGRVIYEKGYRDSTVILTNTSLISDTLKAFRLDQNNPFSSGPDIPFCELTTKDHAWIRSSVEIMLPLGYKGESPILVSTFHYKGQSYKYRGASISENDMKQGTWQTVTYWYLTPEVRTPADNLKVYVWNYNNMPVYIRNLKVEVFELKK